jgi:hypothetical protein
MNLFFKEKERGKEGEEVTPMPELDFSKLPNQGWILNEVIDLGDLAGSCQRCRCR